MRVGEVKPRSCCAPFTLLTKAHVVTSSAPAQPAAADEEAGDEEEGADGCDS